MTMSRIYPESDLMFPEAANHRFVTSGIPENHDDHWGVNNSSLRDYSWGIFGEDDQRLAATIEETVGNEGNAVVDIAGGKDGIAIQELLALGLATRGLVTNLRDRRSEAARNYPGLHHVEGDILLRSTWEQIETWQEGYAPEGFAVVLHRPAGGLQYLDPLFYERAVHRLLGMMRPDGLMVTQVPSILAPFPYYDSSALQQLCCTLQARGDCTGRTMLGGDGRVYAHIVRQ